MTIKQKPSSVELEQRIKALTVQKEAIRQQRLDALLAEQSGDLPTISSKALAEQIAELDQMVSDIEDILPKVREREEAEQEAAERERQEKAFESLTGPKGKISKLIKSVENLQKTADVVRQSKNQCISLLAEVEATQELAGSSYGIWDKRVVVSMVDKMFTESITSNHNFARSKLTDWTESLAYSFIPGSPKPREMILREEAAEREKEAKQRQLEQEALERREGRVTVRTLYLDGSVAEEIVSACLNHPHGAKLRYAPGEKRLDQ
jgi:hypothetical protein